MGGRYRRCRDCGRHDSEVGLISRRGLCEECGERRLLAANRALATGRGQQFDRWRAGIARSVGAELLAEPPEHD